MSNVNILLEPGSLIGGKALYHSRLEEHRDARCFRRGNSRGYRPDLATQALCPHGGSEVLAARCFVIIVAMVIASTYQL